MLARVAALAGLVGVAVAVVLVGLLHVLDADEVDPFRRTISEYALHDHGGVFDAGVLALAVGSALVLFALVRAGIVGWPSWAAVGLVLWTAGMVAVVAFEKTDWAVGPSVGGVIHRYASLVAFLALPVGALTIRRTPGPLATGTRVFAVGALAWLAVILSGVLLRPFTGVPWWQFLPLGLTERGLAATEVALLVVLALRACVRPATPARPEIDESALSLRTR